MAERQQTVTPRSRKTPPKAPRTPAVKRRPKDAAPSLRFVAAVAGFVAVGAAVLALSYFVFFDSKVFALRHVDVLGASRAPVDHIEQVVRQLADGRFLIADLDAVRKAVEDERYVQSASVVRVLPDTIRVQIQEREPAIVARVDNRLVWIDDAGRLLDDFKSQNGEVPPPLAGYEAGDKSERAAADNRDRIATYMKVKEALQQDNLWDRIDEVEIKLLGDVRVRLADTGIQVRLGDREFRERLVRALVRLDQIRKAEEARLSDPAAAAAPPAPGGEKEVRSVQDILSMDAARTDKSVSINKRPGAR